MKRRILGLLLAAALLLSVLPSAFAAEDYSFVVSTYNYPLNSNQCEIVGYEGVLPAKLTIPAVIDGLTVRSIAEEVFSGAPIEEVTLPGTIEELHDAFAGNATLQSAVIGEGTKVIDETFSSCKKLEKVTLPSTLTSVGEHTFLRTALQEVTLPSGLQYIGAWAFAYTKLKSVVLPEGLARIATCAFSDSSLEGRLTLPESVTYLGYSAFSNTALTELVIPSDKTEVTAIPASTWTRIYAHASVWEKNEYAGASRASVISFEELPFDFFAQPTYTEASVTYTTTGGKAYVISCTAAGDFTLPDTLGGCPVTDLLPCAFSGNDDIQRLTLPDTIENIGRKCFVDCGLTLDRLPSGLKSVGEFAFASETEKKTSRNEIKDCTIADGVESIPLGAFEHAKLGKISLPDGLEYIGERAFNSIGATEIVFRGSVKRIGSNAMANLAAKEIVLPEGLETIDGYAFNATAKLEKIVFPSTLTTLGDFPFGYEPPRKLTVWGWIDTPIADLCLDRGISFVDAATGEPVKKAYETEINGVVYRVSPAQNRTEIVKCYPEKHPEVLVIPEQVDGVPVTTIRWFGLAGLTCSGLVLPNSLTSLTHQSITVDNSALRFISMPEREVLVEKDFVYSFDGYFYLPQSFDLAPQCNDYAGLLFRYNKCVGFEKHSSFAPRLTTLDAHADSNYLLTASGVFRQDGAELTAVYMTSLMQDSFVMPSVVNGLPVTKLEKGCAVTMSTVILGDFVRVVEAGAFAYPYGEQLITRLYVPDCIESLPTGLLSKPSVAAVYGKTGTYAEQYAKQCGAAFYDMEKTPFTDVAESAWYFPYVRDAYWLEMMNGTSKTTFDPESPTTRAMVVQVLYNLSGRPSYAYGQVFNDVTGGLWYFDAIGWARTGGVCNGTSETTFSPNDPVTREQLATFLYRYATLCGFYCSTDGNLAAFTDNDKISVYARDAMAWAVGAGIINGKSPTTVEPGSHATRAEIATMLCRLTEFFAQAASAGQ